MAIVYCYTCRINGKSYIGQTWNSEERRSKHLRARKGCTAFYNAIHKYGWESFSYEIIQDDIDDQTMLDLVEWLEIFQRNTLAPNGYNLKEGGGNGRPSPEYVEKVRNAMKGNRIHESLSDEAKKAKAEKCRKKALDQFSNPDKKKRWRESLNNQIKMTPRKARILFDNINSQIRRAHRAHEKIQEEKRKATDPISIEMRRRRTPRPVICLNTGEVFRSAYEAANAKGCVRENIAQVCMGVKKRAGGYRWAYHTDSVGSGTTLN